MPELTTNCLLILTQRPGATQVAGFHAWNALGRSVKKGAKGIAIFAPLTIKFAVDQTQQPPEESRDATGKRLVGFKLTYVFDPLPEVPHALLLEGDAPEQMWEALATQVQGAGYTLELVEQIATKPTAHGVTRPLERIVQIATAGRSRAAQAKCLAHELAHVLLHEDVNVHAERGRLEVEAESVAYLVSAAYGLDSMDYSLGYVTGWSGDNPDVVLATAATVRRCATAILSLALPEHDATSDSQAEVVP